VKSQTLPIGREVESRGSKSRSRALKLRPARAVTGRAIFTALLLVAGPVGLRAHDFWIEPSSFRPAAGSELAVSLRVGEHFRGEPVPRFDPRIVKFVLSSAAGDTPIGGFPGMDPAGLVRVSSPGLALIGYRSQRSSITLEPEKFEKYLADEGLDHVLEIRKKRGEQGKPGNEVYSRCAKSLVAVNGTGESGFDRILGLTLEIVAESNPLKLRAGETMRVRVLHEGKPLAGALVKAIALEDPDNTLSARSEKDGRVSLRLARRGAWLIEAVHMVPAPTETGADWESLWASLTFELP
jgi:uncharacterized GH25 family protein